MKVRKHLVIPDCQVRPGVNTDHLTWIGNYIAEKRPDVVVCLGDFADMVSLNSYQVGKASAEGARYKDDLAASRAAMNNLMRPLMGKDTRYYKPDMVMTLGNHEHRINREAEANPKFVGTISVADLGYAKAGWKVVPFLVPITIDKIKYSHYFVSGVMGRPVSSARALLRQTHCSAVMGHVQMIDIAIHPQTQQIGLFAGIAYTHDEAYLGPQGNSTKRGIWMLNEVREGTFDPMFVSLGFLKGRYS